MTIGCAYGTTLYERVIVTTLTGARWPRSRPGSGHASGHDLSTHPGRFMQDSGHQTSGRERPRPQGAEQCWSGVAHAPTPQLLLFLCAARLAQSAGLSGLDIAQMLAALTIAASLSSHRCVGIDIVRGVDSARTGG
jgi:hypothetical protein